MGGLNQKPTFTKKDSYSQVEVENHIRGLKDKVQVNVGERLISLSNSSYSVDLYYKFRETTVEFSIYTSQWRDGVSINFLDKLMEEAVVVIQGISNLCKVEVCLYSPSFSVLSAYRCANILTLMDFYLGLRCWVFDKPMRFRDIEMVFIEFLFVRCLRNRIYPMIVDNSLILIRVASCSVIITQETKGLRLSHNKGRSSRAELPGFVFRVALEFVEFGSKYSPLCLMGPATDTNVLAMNKYFAVGELNKLVK